MRYIDRFLLDDPLDAPWPVVEYLAAQLGIEDASVVKRYVGLTITALTPTTWLGAATRGDRLMSAL